MEITIEQRTESIDRLFKELHSGRNVELPFTGNPIKISKLGNKYQVDGTNISLPELRKLILSLEDPALNAWYAEDIEVQIGVAELERRFFQFEEKLEDGLTQEVIDLIV